MRWLHRQHVSVTDAGTGCKGIYTYKAGLYVISPYFLQYPMLTNILYPLPNRISGHAMGPLVIVSLKIHCDT